MIPAQERFDADHLFLGRVHDRLINEVKRIVGQGRPQIILKLPAVLDLGQHVRRIEAMDAPSLRLGRVESKIGVPRQRIGAETVVGADGDTH